MSIQKIIILRALFLGDLLCATPALRLLKASFPQAELTLVGLPWAASLVERLPYLDRFLAFPGYPGISEVPYEQHCTQAFLAEARDQYYDIAFQMHGDGTNTNGFVAELGAARSLGYGRVGDQRLDITMLYDDDEHEVLRWLRLVRLAAGRSEAVGLEQDTQIDFPFFPAEQAQADILLAPLRVNGGPLIGLHPGCKDPARRWPAEHFAASGDYLAQAYGAQIVLTGGPEEREITAAVQQHMRTPALDLAGKTGLGTFAAVIGSLDMLLSNDTGASHFAVAARTPSVVLFGPSHPDQWAPLNRSLHHVVDARALTGHIHDGAAALGALPLAPVLAACDMVLGQRERAVGVNVL